MTTQQLTDLLAYVARLYDILFETQTEMHRLRAALPSTGEPTPAP